VSFTMTLSDLERRDPMCSIFGWTSNYIPDAPIKNNPLEKIIYLRNCRFMLFTEEDLGHLSSELHLNIWFDSQIITI